MRAIIINPYDQTITQAPDTGIKYDLAAMYAALTHDAAKRKVDDINSVMLNSERTETLWVDGEGLLFPDIPVWYLGNYPAPLAGIGLVLGLTEFGDNCSTKLIISDFLGPRGVRWTNYLTTGELGPVTQSGNTLTMGAPILKGDK
jgi:hypothetical protein